jgi:hypothetical protein
MAKSYPNYINLTNLRKKITEKNEYLLRKGEIDPPNIFSEKRATADLQVAHLLSISQNLLMLEKVQNEYLRFKFNFELVAEQYKEECGIDLEDVDNYKKPFKHLYFRTQNQFENDTKKYVSLKKMANSYKKMVTLLYFSIEFLVKNTDIDFDKELKEDLDNFIKEFKSQI